MRAGSTEGRDPTQAMRLADTTGGRQMGLCSTGSKPRRQSITKVLPTTIPRPRAPRTTARRTTLTDRHPITAVREEGRLACTILHKATAPRPTTRGRRAPVLRLTNTKPLHICMTTPSRTGMRRIEGAGPREAIPVHTVMGPLDLLALPDRTARPARTARLERTGPLRATTGHLQGAVHLLKWADHRRAASGCIRCSRRSFAMRAASSMISTLTPKIVSRPWILRAARLPSRFCLSPPSISAPAPNVLC